MIPDNIIIVDERDSYSQFVAEWIAKRIGKIIGRQGHCSVGLAGGSTPVPVYRELAESDHSEHIDWQKLSFYFGDERCVSPDHKDSNYRMANETLLSKIPVNHEQVFRIRGEAATPEQAAADYAELLPTALDVLLLGMGEDGHTASLFPGSSALEELQKKVVPAVAPVSPSQRITITPPVISRARTVVVLAAGEKKAEILARALLNTYDPRVIPVQLARLGTWIVDAPASKRLVGMSA